MRRIYHAHSFIINQRRTLKCNLHD